MNKVLFSIYRVVVPKPLRTVIVRKKLRREILEYYPENGNITEEQREVTRYLRDNQLCIFPYPFEKLYHPSLIEVFDDEALGMRYTFLDGKRLYFKKRWSAGRIKRAFSDLLREQDPASPHRYLVPGFDIGPGDVIADIGAAEGNFTLSVIEKAKKSWMFEYSTEWAEALSATFSPYKGKTEVVNWMVSEKDEPGCIMLDTFLNEHPEVNFLKIDVDGAEEVVMKGLSGTLKSKRPLRIALCTYHKGGDEALYTKLLRDSGFEVEHSAGYMIHYYDKSISAPWLRRGLIRATRV
ncbi:MAG: FkbM family methyltransferase [Bacteroidales bacterium]